MTKSVQQASSNDFTGEEHYVMPCAEAVIAATLALMTGHVRCGCAEHRDMMGKKAAENLLALSQQPVLSAGFRAVAARLYSQWSELLAHERQSACDATQPQAAANWSTRESISSTTNRALWHTTPETLQ